MAKSKLAELILSAATAIITAAKSIVKFIGCLGKMRQKPKANACC